MKFLNIASIVKQSITSLFGTGAVAFANYKLGEAEIDGITVEEVDIPSGKITLALEGEVRRVEVVVESFVYTKEETFTIIKELSFVIRSEKTDIRKTWLENLVNNHIRKTIEEDDGIPISTSVKKINAILDRVSFAKEA